MNRIEYEKFNLLHSETKRKAMYLYHLRHKIVMGTVTPHPLPARAALGKVIFYPYGLPLKDCVECHYSSVKLLGDNVDTHNCGWLEVPAGSLVTGMTFKYSLDKTSELKIVSIQKLKTKKIVVRYSVYVKGEYRGEFFLGLSPDIKVYVKVEKK